jgi:outer membrane lipoprotein
MAFHRSRTMLTKATHALLRLAAPAALLALAACAPAPIYKTSASTITAPPQMVSQTPERYGTSDVIWGGQVVGVANLPDHSEIEILTYPLDSSQRPQMANPGTGRFIAVMSGYVEPLNYPSGGLITVSGRLAGHRGGKVGEADYVFPLVSVNSAHVWSQDEMRSNKPNIGIGLGVGVGIR